MSRLALVCDDRSSIDRRAVADALEIETLVGSRLEDLVSTAIERLRAGTHDRVALVAATARAPARERDPIESRLLATGIEDVVWVDPSLARDRSRSDRARLVAAATTAALAVGTPGEPTRDDDGLESHVVVVGDAALAGDVATGLPVTLVTETPPGRRRDGVRAVRGRALDLFADDAGDLTVLVEGPDAPTRIAAEQVIWPGYDGELVDRDDVHPSRRGVVEAVHRVARERAREPVAIDPGRCAVGRAGTDGCRACAAACPHDAVSIEIDGSGSVTIDPDACTDCGACLAACPTEAIDSPRAAPIGALGRATRRALETAADDGSWLPFSGSDPEPVVIAFTARSVLPAVVEASADGPPTVPIPVADAGRVPAALLSAALAAGAGGVAVVADPHEPRSPLERTEEATRRLLEALAIEAPIGTVASDDPETVVDVLRSVARDEPVVDDPDPVRAHENTAAALSATAIETLADGPREGVPAPALGSVSVDAESCTLCSACESLCPTGAIEQPDANVLAVDPAACVGCGRCTACPEDAIAVDDRVSVPLGDRGPVVESDAIVCDRCGEPFAAAAGLATVRDALDRADVPSGFDLDRCPNCRRSAGSAG